MKKFNKMGGSFLSNSGFAATKEIENLKWVEPVTAKAKLPCTGYVQNKQGALDTYLLYFLYHNHPCSICNVETRSFFNTLMKSKACTWKVVPRVNPGDESFWEFNNV